MPARKPTYVNFIYPLDIIHFRFSADPLALTETVEHTALSQPSPVKEELNQENFAQNFIQTHLSEADTPGRQDSPVTMDIEACVSNLLQTFTLILITCPQSQ